MAVPKGAGPDTGSGGARADLYGPVPAWVAWALVAVAFVLLNGRFPEAARGTLLLALLYLALTHASELNEAARRVTAPLARSVS